MTFFLVTLLLCILAEALFSGGEIALLSADKIKLRHVAEQTVSGQRAIQRFLEDPSVLISTSLVGTNICVVLSSVIATLFFLRWMPHHAELLSLAVMTPVIVVFGEILPKSIFQYHADRLAPRIIPIFSVFQIIFSPFVQIGLWLSKNLAEMRDLPEHKVLYSREELSLLLRLPDAQGITHITPDERRMVRRIFDFKGTTVEDVMLPLSEVTALPVEDSLQEVAAEITEQQFTRLPIYKERVDQIVGVVHAFDILRAQSDTSLCDLCRPPIFVPESQRAIDTLMRLQREGQGMAVVVDEYGGATGVVTIEDIIEEIVGEIEDEYDSQEPEAIIREPAGTFRIAAEVSVQRINESLKLGLPLGDDYESLGGLMLDRLRRIPQVGEELAMDGVVLIVLRATDRSIEEVRVKLTRKRIAK